ncbi:MAG: histidine kinase dimerization/phospho-acceptor domain-containing protein [Coprobacillus cateniformis]|uniref:histidine kinase dimerization/phospho-acceptor domain-containing protein n=1 Tax=Coprobacillus cateniformis TaxID=100884 RepID=UPI003995EAC4
MKTNNREFIRLKYIALIILFLFIIIYLVGFSRDIMFVLGIILMGSLYISFQNVVKELYCEMREVIAYAANDQQTIIKDGDLGLLYNEMMRLKKRTVAYEKVIQQEKDKLRQMIEDICHQLKTPLTSISIYNDLLLDERYKTIILKKLISRLKK